MVATTDLLALTHIVPPGEWGADVAVGSSQRFGVPLGNGGPHAAFMAVRSGLERALPGRLVGDVASTPMATPPTGSPCRRASSTSAVSGATSNICTAQVLLAVIAGAYAVYHGPEGLEAIAARVHRMAGLLAASLARRRRRGRARIVLRHGPVTGPGRAAEVVASAAGGRGEPATRRRRPRGRRVRRDDDRRDRRTVVLRAFGVEADAGEFDEQVRAADPIAGGERRTSAYLTSQVFGAHRSETSMLRYLRRLADADLALDRAMIPLGSCTMKLNATAEMEPDHVAGVRLDPPVRSGRAGGPATSSSSATSSGRSPRSPATTRCRSSRTPARRASWRVCSPSASWHRSRGDVDRTCA